MSASKKQRTEADAKVAVDESAVILARNSNQALGIAQFAIDFLAGKLGKGPDPAVFKRVELFHTDSVVCGLSALALRTNAPTILRDEALEEYERSSASKAATVFGSDKLVAPEKAICANCAAVREWDSNGTVFGFNRQLGHLAGEFGHNDFYPVVIAACQMRGLDGAVAARAMILLDEIRGRLCEVFSLKSYKIDHVVHGAIASAAVYGALMGATAEQIESAIGMVVAHFIPWRAIRAGKQLSDSKGASAALSTEVAIVCVHRSMRGFVGPRDIFRNPEAIFRYFEPQKDGHSPFTLNLSHSGSGFAVMGMHFKLGLYEHQSAGALQALIDVLRKDPTLADAKGANIASITIRCYEPAFGIIGDPAKLDPRTRQSADHSMVYIVAATLKKALALGSKKLAKNNDDVWKQLILLPEDYTMDAILDKETRALMGKISFEHGGPEYDRQYPEGIPTTVFITDSRTGRTTDSGLIMFPSGHARNADSNLEEVLHNKFECLGAIAVGRQQVSKLLGRLADLANKSAEEIRTIYNVNIKFAAHPME